MQMRARQEFELQVFETHTFILAPFLLSFKDSTKVKSWWGVLLPCGHQEFCEFHQKLKKGIFLPSKLFPTLAKSEQVETMEF